MTAAITITSIEATYRRPSVSTRNYDAVTNRAVGTVKFWQDFGDVRESSEDLEITEVAGKDYDGHDRMFLSRDAAGKCYLASETADKRDDSVFNTKGEVEFVKGTWETHEKGEEVEIVYTRAGLKEVSRQFANWMETDLISVGQSALESELSEGVRVVHTSVTADRVSFSNDPVVVGLLEMRLDGDSPTEFVMTMRFVLERKRKNWAWVLLPLLVAGAVGLARRRKKTRLGEPRQ